MINNKIVFLPGTLCDGRIFRPQIQALESNGFDCIDVDLTQCASLDEAVQTCLAGLEPHAKFSIVAFSMGGMVAFELLRQCPERVQNIILVASNAHADLPERAEARAQHLAQAKATGLNELIANTYMPNYLFKQRQDDQQMIVKMAEDLGVEAFENQLHILADRPDSSSLLEKIKCPVLLIGGEEDPLCSVTEQQRIHGLISNSEMVIYSEAGHFVSLDQADKVTEDMLNWFKEHANG